MRIALQLHFAKYIFKMQDFVGTLNIQLQNEMPFEITKQIITVVQNGIENVFIILLSNKYCHFA